MIAAGVRALREMYVLTKELRNLRVLTLSAAVSTLGGGMLDPVFPVYLESRGLDLKTIGLVFTIGSILPVFLQPTLGALSDRFSRKGFVVSLSLLTSLLIPAFTLFSQPFALAVVLAMKLMISQSAAPLSSALIADFAPANQRATVFALMDSAINLVFVAALAISGVAVNLLSIQGVFYVSGGLFIVSSLTLFGLRETPSRVLGPVSDRPGWAVAAMSMVSLVLDLKSSPSFLRLFVYQFCFAFGLNLFPVYLPLYALKLGASQAVVGPLLASSWLLYALVQPMGGRLSDRSGRRKGLITAGLAGMVVFSLLLSLASWAPQSIALSLMAAAWMLLALPDGLFRPSAMALAVECAPLEERGRILGSLGTAGSLANMLAPLSYGLVASRAGLGAAFLLCSGAFALALGAMATLAEPAPAPFTPASSELG